VNNIREDEAERAWGYTPYKEENGARRYGGGKG
jgi:hypothetical protein